MFNNNSVRVSDEINNSISKLLQKRFSKTSKNSFKSFNQKRASKSSKRSFKSFKIFKKGQSIKEELQKLQNLRTRDSKSSKKNFKIFIKELFSKSSEKSFKSFKKELQKLQKRTSKSLKKVAYFFKSTRSAFIIDLLLKTKVQRDVLSYF